MEHSLHIILLSAGLLAGLTIWFWDSIKNKGFQLRSFAILLLILFILLHVSPLGLTMAYHHQSQDHTTQHPCCMPQVAISVVPMVTPEAPSHTEHPLIIKAITQPAQIVHTINNRSPPAFS